MSPCKEIQVNQDKELINILKFLCEAAHKLTNMGIYYARQLYFKTQIWGFIMLDNCILKLKKVSVNLT
ncbi:hypothetical protein [Okeania sp. SIO3I5]|uniref:hypothetical protein n=1 Tax=Okeania sp. SIO3I5 TaxID=2607805 RepID=UPI0025F6C358|nr:hypothetical protein [Okeania sp. SIO3I5]